MVVVVCAWAYVRTKGGGGGEQAAGVNVPMWLYSESGLVFDVSAGLNVKETAELVVNGKVAVLWGRCACV